MKKVIINGRRGVLFCTPEAAEKAKVKEEYPYLYFLRHGDKDWTRPVTIEKFAVCNRFGVVLLEKPLRFRKNRDYVRIREYHEEGQL